VQTALCKETEIFRGAEPPCGLGGEVLCDVDGAAGVDKLEEARAAAVGGDKDEGRESAGHEEGLHLREEGGWWGESGWREIMEKEEERNQIDSGLSRQRNRHRTT
jgi:hypothetical protein